MSRKWAAAAAAVACFGLTGVPAEAHHSIQATVDTGKVVQGEMVLTKVDWVNPHAWFHFSMTKPDGGVVKDVAVEWMGLSGLRQEGYASADAFTVGHTFRVNYNPNRDGTVGGHLVSMVDQSTGTVYGRGGPGPLPAPPPAPPPRPQLRPVGIPTTNASF